MVRKKETLPPEVARWMKELEESMDQKKELRVQLAHAESRLKIMGDQEIKVKEVMKSVLNGEKPISVLGPLINDDITNKHHRTKVDFLEEELSHVKKDLTRTETLLVQTEQKLIDALGKPSFEASIIMIRNQCVLLPMTPHRRERVKEFASKIIELKSHLSKANTSALVDMISDGVQVFDRASQTITPKVSKTNGRSSENCCLRLYCLQCGSGPHKWSDEGINNCLDCGELLQRTGSELLLWQQHTSNWLRKMISLRQRSPYTLSKLEALLEKPRPMTAPVSCKTGRILKKTRRPPLPSKFYKDAPSLSLVGVPNYWCGGDVATRGVIPAFGKIDVCESRKSRTRIAENVSGGISVVGPPG